MRLKMRLISHDSQTKIKKAALQAVLSTNVDVLYTRLLINTIDD